MDTTKKIWGHDLELNMTIGTTFLKKYGKVAVMQSENCLINLSFDSV